MKRRDFLALAGTSAASLALSGCSAQNLPLRVGPPAASGGPATPLLELFASPLGECRYQARLEGSLPGDLDGVLYRNGPGLLQRNGLYKRCLLDGDGMIQAFRIGNGTVSFQNRFVRTAKFQAESRAGRFIYATWSTQAPGGVFANLLGGRFESQAGVTVLVRDGRLYAFDEYKPPYRLDPETLETMGESWLGLQKESTVFSAHSKIDPVNGDWIFSGLEYKFKATLHLTVLSSSGALKKHQTFELPRYPYLHDFFVTENFIIINLHPVEIGLVALLSGQKSLAGSLTWHPKQGNLVLVFDRARDSRPVQVFTETSWMWHSLNAYEQGGEIIADFVGYENPDHVLGRDPALFAVMEGRSGEFAYNGELRRYLINPQAGKIRQEVIDPGNHEFPTLNLLLLTRRHRYGYFLSNTRNGVFFSAIVRVDLKSGRSAKFDFGPGMYCSEPVFARKPGTSYHPDRDREPGWLLSEVLDTRRKLSFLAVFRAEDLSAGPLACAYLRDQVPLGFHGFWKSG